MGIFDSILLEGQQADEYRARKEKEAADKKDSEEKRNSRRYELTNGMYLQAGTKDNRSGSSKDSEKYRGEGKRSDYPIISNDDADRKDKSIKMVEDESKRRYDRYDKDYESYKNASNRYRNNPLPEGDRPRGPFKGKQKKEYDDKMKKNIDAKKGLKAAREKLNSSEKDYDRIRTDSMYATDAANRHIRRHPKQYKESGIFESVEVI